MEIGRFLRAAVDVVLPRACVICGCRLNLQEKHLCLGCLADMPLTRYWERRSNPMADKFNERIQRGMEREMGEMDGENEHERYAYAAALFFYHSEAEYRKIPYLIKYQGNIAIGKYFGRMLGRKLAGSSLWADADMVIPVPLHWTRQWQRGYNQAEVIAGAVAREMGIVMKTDILVRLRRTKTQVEMGVEQKVRNVSGAFAVTEEAGREIKKILQGIGSRKNIRHILLVDDVFTTGSTLASCFMTLRKAIPKHIRISAVSLGYLER